MYIIYYYNYNSFYYDYYYARRPAGETVQKKNPISPDDVDHCKFP